MNNKKITFHSSNTEYDILAPQPASRFIPEWFRKMKGEKNRGETVKKCIPFLDSLTTGYIIPLPVDVTWNKEKQEFSDIASITVTSAHFPTQTDMVTIPKEFNPQPFKWNNSWHISTPKGYSTMFVHPLNRLDLPFQSFSGIVDTDKHPLVINFPFIIRDDFDGVIPAGTPLIQAIPFKRNNWDSKVVDTGKSHSYPYVHEVELPPFNWYKRKWWTKKFYS